MLTGSESPTTEYDRDQLIAICERAVVPEQFWFNRDTAGAQSGVGQCWALLKAGCEFEILTAGMLASDSRTIWVKVFPRGFQSVEWGREEGRERDAKTFYLPTETRLDDSDGKDWY